MMKGWKTWLAAGAMVALAVVDFVSDRQASGMQHLAEALAFVGIGSKIEKAAG